MSNCIDWTKLEEKPYAPLAQLARRAAAEGSVLLKNEGNILPIGKDTTISLFGRTQIDYNKSGTGSGGLVRVEYVVNILDGIAANPKLTLNEELVEVYKNWLKDNPFDAGEGWAKEPWCQVEMVPSEETVKRAREISDTAVIVIGRTAGEDRDNHPGKGSWSLSDEEEAMLSAVCKEFDKTVVLLNVGNIIDMSWVEKYNIKSVLYVWQGGQEGGNAVADILCGDVTPCGKLTDTIAKNISDYPSIKNFGDEKFNIYEEDIFVGYRYFETFAPEKVLYPFGYGLSYTDFEYKTLDTSAIDGNICVETEITNTGKYSGREIIQVYCEAPQGKLGKSARVLCGFGKTDTLAPGESEIVKISFPVSAMASYDDSGITGNKSCYVLEEGDYNIYAGGCVRCAEKVFTYTAKELVVTEKCTEALSPVRSFDIMTPIADGNGYREGSKSVCMRTIDYAERIKAEIPKEITPTGDRGIKLIDVKNGKNTMDEFVAQLSDTDLECLARGEGMCSPKVRAGSAGAIGGTTQCLASFGIPIVAVHDGPSGIRMDSNETATSMPNGTAIACTWDEEIAEKLYENLSIELCTHRIDSILGPGMNIHRVPLNGRNFEYFSEDPLVTGKIAAAMVRGVKKYGNSATIKHFAANSQEFSRTWVDAVMSERAAREIYLKGFEIAVKEGGATSLMTSYNPINGVWSANNYDLNTIILREEWGYKGLVMTDWWPRLWPETLDYINLKNMIEAQNDVYMPAADALTFKDNLDASLADGTLTRAQLQRNAANILGYVANSHALERFVKYGGKLEPSLAEDMDKLISIATVENPQNDTETELDLGKKGKYLICMDYSSDEPEITQMTVRVLVNNVSAANITVNGNSGKCTVVARDISIGVLPVKLKLLFEDSLVRINSIELKRLP